MLANGAIPVTNLAKDAGPIQVLENVGERVRRRDRARRRRTGCRASTAAALAAADYDNDGDVDVAVNSIGGKLMLLRNDGRRRPLARGEAARASPRRGRHRRRCPDGRRLVREVHAGTSYLSSEDPRVHFGLGTATKRARADSSATRTGTTTRLRATSPADRIVDRSAADASGPSRDLEPADDRVERDGEEQDRAGDDVDRSPFS